MRKLVINAYNRIARIDPKIYGNFSEHLGRCIYNGIYVGENSPIPNVNGMRTDLVEALKKMKLPFLRWPGGCFADEYHWKDGIGPKESRKTIVNTNWGGVTETNAFGTHEFLELCRQVGCEPYICGNVGSGTVQELSEWVEYMNFDGVSPMADLRRKNGQDEPWRIKYLAVGNESWGCGGRMTAERYAEEFLRYANFCRSYPGAPLFKVACGPSSGDAHWTDVLMEKAGKDMDGIALHHYCYDTDDWNDKGPALGFGSAQWYSLLKSAYRMEEMVSLHSAIMDRWDPQRRVALLVDEWGAWYAVEPGTNPAFLYQQNTVRDALVAGLTLNIFNKHAQRVRGANIAQLINVLQSVALTDGEKVCLTPTYHVFEMYKEHQGGELLESFIQQEEVEGIPDVTESVSVGEDGAIFVTLCNLTLDKTVPVDAVLVGAAPKSAEAYIVTGEPDGHNTFDQPENITKRPYTAALTHGGFTVTLPPRSVVSVRLW